MNLTLHQKLGVSITAVVYNGALVWLNTHITELLSIRIMVFIASYLYNGICIAFVQGRRPTTRPHILEMGKFALLWPGMIWSNRFHDRVLRIRRLPPDQRQDFSPSSIDTQDQRIHRLPELTILIEDYQITELAPAAASLWTVRC